MAGDHAGQLATLEHHTPAGARAEELSFGQMLKRAEVLAKSKLVPKSLQGEPEAIVLVGALGAELGIPFVTSLSEIHVIEGRPSPSAQMRLALVRRAGHEAEFVETTDEHAVIRGRRQERRDDPAGWVTVEWTMGQAQRAGLVDRWVEKWTKNSENRNVKLVEVVGDRDGIFTAEERERRGLKKDLPDWAKKALDAGEIKQKDNWVKYPADMLRARAASTLCRMAFSDVLAGLGAAPHTAEELGIEVAQDVDEPPAAGDHEDEIFDAEIVEPEPGEDPSLTPAQAPGSPSGTPIAEPEGVGDNGGAGQVVGAPVAPSSPGPVDWREVAKTHGVTVGGLLIRARTFAEARGLPAPASIEDVTDPGVVADLMGWLEAA